MRRRYKVRVWSLTASYWTPTIEAQDAYDALDRARKYLQARPALRDMARWQLSAVSEESWPAAQREERATFTVNVEPFNRAMDEIGRADLKLTEGETQR
jgi:hypothetical protein